MCRVCLAFVKYVPCHAFMFSMYVYRYPGVFEFSVLFLCSSLRVLFASNCPLLCFESERLGRIDSSGPVLCPRTRFVREKVEY